MFICYLGIYMEYAAPLMDDFEWRALPISVDQVKTETE